MSAVLEKILEEIKALSLEEKKEVRDKVEEWLSETETPEIKLQQALYEEGLLNEIRPPRQETIQHDFSFIEIQGKPLSETIIEERR